MGSEEIQSVVILYIIIQDNMTADLSKTGPND